MNAAQAAFFFAKTGKIGLRNPGLRIFKASFADKKGVVCYTFYTGSRFEERIQTMKLNEKIAECRKRMGLSQEELAARIGVSRQAVSKWEVGDAVPEVDKILALAHIFDISTDELLGHVREEKEDAAQEDGFSVRAEAFAQGARGNDELPRGLRFFGRAVRKWGHVAGYIVALRGLGVTAVGCLAQWMFGRMFSLTVNTGTESMIVMGDGFSMDMTGDMFPSFAAPDPFDAMSSIPLTFANIIILFGVLMVLGGLALAWYLKKKAAEN